MRVDEIVDRESASDLIIKRSDRGMFVVISEALMLFIPVTRNALNAFSFFSALEKQSLGACILRIKNSI